MEHDIVDTDVARRSARMYVPLSLGAGLAFYLAATFVGGNGLVARLGGATWVTLLSFIVSMPIVTSRVKTRARK
ncbi:MAG TPA: hypothetical protein VFI11_01680 [Anaerolineales bacterium]|nr:hypothetical protein [Anaerolineales bacterium]